MLRAKTTNTRTAGILFDQVHRTIGIGFYFSWCQFLFVFFQNFPNVCGQLCGLDLINVRFLVY